MKLNRTYRGDYILGKFIKASQANGEVHSLDPGDLSQEDLVFPFQFSHVSDAVSAARRSQRSWRRIPPSDRLSVIAKYCELLKKRKDIFAQLIATEIGKPMWEAEQEVQDCVQLVETLLGAGESAQKVPPAQKIEHEVTASILFQPRGVVAITSPTDLPGYGPHRYFIPALIHGNTVVIKSSKYAPTVTQFLAQISHESGIPAGVFNVIHGDYEVTRRLVSHPDVDGIFYSGSFEKALKLMKQILSDYRKNVVVETGGKNATILWEDCNYERALYEVFYSTYATSGQRNRSTRQVIVHDNYFDRFLKDFHKLSKECKIGYAFDKDTQPFMGPLISEKAVDNYLLFQGIAVREGCEEIMRGKALERGHRGYYVSPSIHLVGESKPKSIYETSEIFGPNTALYRVKDLDGAISIINNSEYGLVTSFYSQSNETFQQIAGELKVGQLHWNLPTLFSSEVIPHGGLKKSGNGRPLGSLTPEQCTYPVCTLEAGQPAKLPQELPRL